MYIERGCRSTSSIRRSTNQRPPSRRRALVRRWHIDFSRSFQQIAIAESWTQNTCVSIGLVYVRQDRRNVRWHYRVILWYTDCTGKNTFRCIDFCGFEQLYVVLLYNKSTTAWHSGIHDLLLNHITNNIIMLHHKLFIFIHWRRGAS